MLSITVMGCDTHLDTIAASVVDQLGTERVSVEVPNSVSGWAHLNDLCRQHQVGLVGIEGASGYGKRLSQTLTGTGIQVLEVPTRLTARTRNIDGAGKTDRGDARTVARAVARGDGHRWVNTPNLETLRVLTTRRNHLVNAQTADINQMRALITELDPVHASQLVRIRSVAVLTRLANYQQTGDNHTETVTGLIRDIADQCLKRRATIKQLEQNIETNMPPAGHQLINEIKGCGTIVAAQLLAQIAGAGHFATDAKLAAWAGTAPLDASSGRQQRHRLNRTGNRQANRAIHTIIITQIRSQGKAADYLTRRTSEGKTRKEAIRAAKRHLTRTIWKILQQHQLT